MPRQSPSPIRPRDVVRIVFRHRWKIAISSIAIVASTIVALMVLPRTYASQSKILVRVGRETVTLDPTASSGQTNPLHKSLEAELQSVQDLLASRAIYEQIVAELTPDYILAPPTKKAAESGSDAKPWFSLDDAKNTLRGWCISSGILDDVPLNEKAVKQLERSFHVEAERSSSVITITCKANEPERAQAILESFLAAAREQHVRVNHIQGSHAFFAEQIEVLQKQWEEESAKLRDLKNQQHLVSVDGQRKNLELEMQVVESARATTVSQLAASQALADSLKKQIDALPARHVAQETSGFANAASDALRQRLHDLQIREAELISKFTPEHRQVIDIREQIAQATKAVASEPELRTQTTEAIHPARNALDLQLAQEKAQLDSIQARLTALEAQKLEIYTRVEDLNEGERQIDRLQREVDVLATNLSQYHANVEQSRISEALEANRISNLNIVQPPSLMATAIFPKPLLVLAAGIVLAIGASLSLAFVSEYLDPSLSTSQQVSSALQVPVLLTVPRSSRSLPRVH